MNRNAENHSHAYAIELHYELFRFGLNDWMNTRVYKKESRDSILIDTDYREKFGMVDILKAI